MTPTPARIGWFGDRAVSPRYETDAVPFDPAHLVIQLARRPRSRPQARTAATPDFRP